MRRVESIFRNPRTFYRVGDLEILVTSDNTRIVIKGVTNEYLDRAWRRTFSYTFYGNQTSD